jgi:O-antigen ligase
VIVMNPILMIIAVVLLLISWLWEARQQHEFSYCTLLIFVCLLTAGGLRFADVPIYTFTAPCLIVSSVVLYMLAPKQPQQMITDGRTLSHRNLGTKVKWCYGVFLLCYFISTVFMEYEPHYPKHMAYFMVSIVAAFYVLNLFEKYKDANLIAAYGLFGIGIVTSILVWQAFITSGGGFVRGLPQGSLFTLMFGHAGHYNICITAIISGIILWGYAIDARKQNHNDSRFFFRQPAFLLGAIIFNVSALLLTLGRGALLEMIMFVAIFVCFYDQKKKIVLPAAIIIVALFFLFTTPAFQQSDIYRGYAERFEQGTDADTDDPLARFFGVPRAERIRIILEKSELSLLGDGRGAAGEITSYYYGGTPHNDYLEILIDGGIISFVAYLAVFVVLAIYGIRLKGTVGFIITIIAMHLMWISAFAGEYGILHNTVLIGLACGVYKHLAYSQATIVWPGKIIMPLVRFS